MADDLGYVSPGSAESATGEIGESSHGRPKREARAPSLFVAEPYPGWRPSPKADAEDDARAAKAAARAAAKAAAAEGEASRWYWVSRANSGENFPHDPARLFDTTVRVAALLYASLGGSNATDHALNPRKFRSVYWDTFSYSLYAHQLRRLRSLGFEHVGVMLSERFRVQPALAANAVWQWLGFPQVRYDAGDEGGHTYWNEYSRWTGHPMHKRAKRACMPCFPNGHHGKVAMLPQTRELLDEVFRGEIAEIERLVPGLDLEKWWNVTL